jgi:two-component system, OmpR family, response regulator
VAKILIVDDNGDLRTLLGLCFLRCGHSIVVASNGAAALECLAVHAPDLLVTDVNMPVMDGLELLRRLRADGQHDLPVILFSARSDLCAPAAAAGADAFLVKPVPLRELAEAGERLLGKRDAPGVGR